MIVLNENSSAPLYQQLYTQLKAEILEHYDIGDKLPSIRKLAQAYSLSKNTVESAFSQLYAEGYIESRPKVGYFVSDILLDLPSAQTKNTSVQTQKSDAEILYDFYPARLTQDSFPLKTWKRLSTKALSQNLDFGAYPEGQGELGLRQEIAKYLIDSRAVQCDAEQIIITSGFADSMGLLSEILKSRHSILATEHPGYPIASKTFIEHGYSIAPIKVKDDGLDVEELETTPARLVYITPSHQYPSGVVMSITKRTKLLKWAKKVDGYIIEDDYNSELNYKNRPIPSLQGLDNDDRVVYLGTFSKSLSPALRLGYMVLPKRLILEYKRLFYVHFSKVALSTQKTLELFMAEGHWAHHLRKIRTINRKKHDLVLQLLKQTFKERIKIITYGGGLGILILPTQAMDLQSLRLKCAQEGIKLYLASDFYGKEYEAIRMGFGGLSLEEIPQAIKLFEKIFKNM